MKKPINLITLTVSILIIIGLIVGAVFLIPHFIDNKEDEPTLVIDNENLELLKATSLSNVKNYIEANKMEALLSDDGKIYIFDDVKLSSGIFDLTFQSDDTGALKRVDGDCTITLNSNDEESMDYKLSVISGTVTEFFDLEIDPDYIIYDSEGAPIDSTVKEPIKELLNGKVKYVITAIDSDGTYWYLSLKKTENSEENKFTLEFFHYFKKGVYDNGTEVINLTEPEE